MRKIILNQLKKYINKKTLRYDVPGHKGNFKVDEFDNFWGENVIKNDTNSLPMLDNLNHPNGVIKKSQKEIAKIHKAKDSRILVNGTTLGIHAMILATTKENEIILIPRNAHKSVHTGIVLSGAKPVYMTPRYDEELNIYTFLDFAVVKEAINKYPRAKTILLINPSYYGFSKDLEKIINFCKKKGKIIIADEAHGGFNYFFDNSMKTAIELGADLSTISYHKSLGALTQGSLMLLNTSKEIEDDINQSLAMLTTTSPSYLLMTSVESACSYMSELSTQKKKKLQNIKTYLKEEINNLKLFTIIDNEFYGVNEENDISKILIDVSNISLTGYELYTYLFEKYNVQVELAEFNIILLIIGIGDTIENAQKIISCLREVEEDFPSNKKKKLNLYDRTELPKINENLKTPREIFYSPKKYVELNKAVNKICGQAIMIYPPGIDIIQEGQIFTKQDIKLLNRYRNEHIEIQGMKNTLVRIIDEENYESKNPR